MPVTLAQPVQVPGPSTAGRGFGRCPLGPEPGSAPDCRRRAGGEGASAHAESRAL